MENSLVPPKQCCIIGGGLSVQEGLSKGLLDKIKNKFIIGLNCVYKLIPSTFICFVDSINFYQRFIKELPSLPLLVGKKTNDSIKLKLPNTLLLKHSNTYQRDCKRGIYGEYLAGLFSLSLALYLLDVGTCFLLGYDGGVLPPKSNTQTLKVQFNKKTFEMEVEDVTDNLSKIKNKTTLIKQNGRWYRPISHWYQKEIEHTGIGKIKPYYLTHANEMFNFYKDENKIKIYNVSPDSRISTFEKIDYDKMFELLDDNTYNQEELREWIKIKLGELGSVCK